MGFDFLQPENPKTSSLFLFAKIEEGTLGVTSATTTTRLTSPDD